MYMGFGTVANHAHLNNQMFALRDVSARRMFLSPFKERYLSLAAWGGEQCSCGAAERGALILRIAFES
jgi:hypothetical protein